MIKNIYYNVKEGIRNLFVWFPIIWKLREFDYQYGVELFVFYIRRLKKSIEKNQNHVEWKRDVDKMNTFLKMYEFYDSLGYYDREHLQLEKENISTDIFNNDDTPEQRERRKELFREYTKKQERLRNILWRYLYQNLEYWWD